MPVLWDQTIKTHRREVGDAILDSTADLVGEHGLRAVTMSQIAETAGIGRATLYRYFSSVDAILSAWHSRQIASHLDQLTEAAGRAGTPGERLAAVFESYGRNAFGSHGRHDAELVTFLHRDEHVGGAHEQLQRLIRDLIAEGAGTGELRNDVPPGELAMYCLRALTAASGMRTKAALGRLVTVILAGLAPAARA